METNAFNFTEVHKSEIKAGDTILHNGILTTVCKKDIKNCSFNGPLVFGDSYNCGRKKVLKGIYKGVIK